MSAGAVFARLTRPVTLFDAQRAIEEWWRRGYVMATHLETKSTFLIRRDDPKQAQTRRKDAA